MFDISCHLSLPPNQMVQVANSYNCQTIRSQCEYMHTGHKQEGLHRQLKMTHRLCHLKYPWYSYILKIYQNHQFLCGKTQKFERVCIFVLVIYPQIYHVRRKDLKYILTLDEESKKHPILVTTGEFLLNIWLSNSSIIRD